MKYYEKLAQIENIVVVQRLNTEETVRLILSQEHSKHLVFFTDSVAEIFVSKKSYLIVIFEWLYTI